MENVLDLQNLIHGFKLSCQAEGKSPKTIEWYTNFLNRFLQFLKTGGYPTKIDNRTSLVFRSPYRSRWRMPKE